MLTAEQALDQLRTESSVTVDEVAAALAVIDQDAALEQVLTRVAWTVWDKASPVGDLDAPTILAQAPAPVDVAYIVTLDGQSTMFQLYVPGGDGHAAMDLTTAQVTASDAATTVATTLADQVVLGMLRNQFPRDRTVKKNRG